MDVLITVLLFALGIVLIMKGGDFFVDAASWIAGVSGIPKLIIGATVVSVATTLPEMLVSVFAALRGNAEMCIGNAVGSVTANIGLIMAISLICMPTVIKRKDYFLMGALMLTASAMMVIFSIYGKVGKIESILLLIVCAVMWYKNISSAVCESKKQSEERMKITGGAKEIVINILKFIGGAAGIVWGADLLVDNGTVIAGLLGVPDRVIAVTLVAVGTSLPELVTTLTAIAKKEHSLSVGNIIGANILDLTLIMPASALISGKDVDFTSMSPLDIPVCLVVGIIAIVPALIFKKFARWQGILLLAVYAVYVGVTCFA